jgi:hypothetical protein
MQNQGCFGGSIFCQSDLAMSAGGMQQRLVFAAAPGSFHQRGSQAINAEFHATLQTSHKK